MGCAICCHVYTQKHRLIPGRWGGTYDEENIFDLCPNHHAAVHLLIKWQHKKPGLSTAAEWDRLEAYHDDRALMQFWAEEQKPVVIERMKAEGRWHPYVRTLPPEKAKT